MLFLVAMVRLKYPALTWYCSSLETNETRLFRKYFTEKAGRVVSTAFWFTLHGFKVSDWSVSKWISDWKSSYQQCSKRLKLPLL